MSLYTLLLEPHSTDCARRDAVLLGSDAKYRAGGNDPVANSAGGGFTRSFL